ncbi:ASCH domain-containing protein [Austwickia sp. TVS 96-490-7B]|uniref:ASCH domain-containing protein n=1 Tax=Austwickia sp. TVS 96-490-7B TaxID=2830843 RepID=UPI001C5696A0|nr:ASCH domain-containing protein [Austwickia sp. TVS 96-490-7B]
MGQADIEAFWADARLRTRLSRPAGSLENQTLGPTPPLAWAFGGVGAPEQADELLGLVLRGLKTATASSLWDYEYEGEALPEVGRLSIVLDGEGMPRALIQTTSVDIVPFDQVGPEHVVAEAEGDLSVEHWREVHEWFFRENSSNPRGFQPDMPVVLERFAVIYPTAAEREAARRQAEW